MTYVYGECSIRCADCIHCAPYGDDGWCDILRVAVTPEHSCDNYECIDL